MQLVMRLAPGAVMGGLVWVLVLDGSKNSGRSSFPGKRNGIANKGIRCWHMSGNLGQQSGLSVKGMMRILNWVL